MNILVTGGGGFIGSHVAERYIEEGHEVTVIDNLSIGKREWVPEKAEFVEVDIKDEERLREVFENNSFDVINHHAAHNDAMGSLENPVKDAKDNIIGSIKLLEEAKKHGINRIIYASSGGLSYGEPQELPTGEGHEMKPSYPYGISKHSVEHYLELYSDIYDIEFIVLRYASVYGPRATGGVIKNFLDAVERNEKPKIFGDGTQTRDFIHVKDVTRANLLALEKGQEFYNIGTQEETSVNKLWNLVQRLTEHEKKPEHRERWTGDIDRCRLDYSKAEKQLNWTPEIGLEEGLRMLIRQRSNLND